MASDKIFLSSVSLREHADRYSVMKRTAEHIRASIEEMRSADAPDCWAKYTKPLDDITEILRCMDRIQKALTSIAEDVDAMCHKNADMFDQCKTEVMHSIDYAMRMVDSCLDPLHTD